MNDYNIILYLYICDPVYVLVIIEGGEGGGRVCDGGQSWS